MQVEKRFRRVQAVVKSKGVHTKYWLLTLSNFTNSSLCLHTFQWTVISQYTEKWEKTSAQYCRQVLQSIPTTMLSYEVIWGNMDIKLAKIMRCIRVKCLQVSGDKRRIRKQPTGSEYGHKKLFLNKLTFSLEKRENNWRIRKEAV